MNGSSGLLKILGIIVGVVAVGLLIGWLGTRNAPKPPPLTDLDPAAPATTSRVASAVNRSNAAVPTIQPQPAPATTNVATPLTIPPPANLITNWEDRIDEILTADTDDAVKTKQMMQMFPNLPEDGQVEVAQHMANLTPDEQYAGLGSNLTNSALPEAVLDILLSDLLNRPNSAKLPLLYEIARDERNPKSAEAKDLMELFLEENYGDNWPQWQTAMQQWLKDNPD